MKNQVNNAKTNPELGLKLDKFSQNTSLELVKKTRKLHFVLILVVLSLVLLGCASNTDLSFMSEGVKTVQDLQVAKECEKYIGNSGTINLDDCHMRLAIESRDIKFCDSIYDKSIRTTCMAHISGDKKLCNDMKIPSQKQVCLSWSASTKEDCDAVIPSLRKNCIKMMALHREISYKACDFFPAIGDRDTCLKEVNYQLNQSSICELIITSSKKDYCYYGLAGKNVGAEFCDFIKDSNPRQRCIEEAYTPSDCDKFTREEDKKFCKEIVPPTPPTIGEPADCSNTKDMSDQNDCLNKHIIRTGDISLCKQFAESPDSCIEYHARNFENSSIEICGLISSGTYKWRSCIEHFAKKYHNPELCLSYSNDQEHCFYLSINTIENCAKYDDNSDCYDRNYENAKTSDICIKVSDRKKDDCYLYFGRVDKNICEKITDEKYKESCKVSASEEDENIYRKAVARFDVKNCDNIKLDSLKTKCKAITRLNADGCLSLTGSDKNDCLYEVLRNKLDPEVCKKFDNPDKCLIDFLEEYLMVEACPLFNDTTFIEKCYASIAIRTKNVVLCKNVKNLEISKKCESEIGLTSMEIIKLMSKIPEGCEMCSEGVDELCSRCVVNKLKDPEFCMMIPRAETSAMCVYHYAIDNKDVSACDKIPFFVDPYELERDSSNMKEECRLKAAS